MALVKMLRGGVLTLPAGVRETLQLDEGSLLEAEVVDGKVELRFLVTGDRRHLLRLGECEGVRIVTPRQLLALL